MNSFLKFAACAGIVVSVCSCGQNVEDIAKKANTPEECVAAMIAIMKTVKDVDSEKKAEAAIKLVEKKVDAFNEADKEKFMKAFMESEKELTAESERIDKLNLSK